MRIVIRGVESREWRSSGWEGKGWMDGWKGVDMRDRWMRGMNIRWIHDVWRGLASCFLERCHFIPLSLKIKSLCF